MITQHVYQLSVVGGNRKIICVILLQAVASAAEVSAVGKQHSGDDMRNRDAVGVGPF